MRWRNFVRELFHGGPLLDCSRFVAPLPKTTMRLYRNSDFERCSEIYRLNEVGRFPEGYLALYQAYLQKGDTRIIVIEESGQVVGTGGISLTKVTDEFRLVTLSYGLIHPDFQGRGFGTILFCARLSYLSAWQNWIVYMTSAGNGTETFYENLGFKFVSSVEDEYGSRLEEYQVKVLGRDVARFYELVMQSGSAKELDFDKELPEKDHREKFSEYFTDGRFGF